MDLAMKVIYSIICVITIFKKLNIHNYINMYFFLYIYSQSRLRNMCRAVRIFKDEKKIIFLCYEFGFKDKFAEYYTTYKIKIFNKN